MRVASARWRDPRRKSAAKSAAAKPSTITAVRRSRRRCVTDATTAGADVTRAVMVARSSWTVSATGRMRSSTMLASAKSWETAAKKAAATRKRNAEHHAHA